ncbi:hypothetical protein Hanom_Chr00s000003g01605451 [Helianthus anomalus]
MVLVQNISPGVNYSVAMSLSYLPLMRGLGLSFVDKKTLLHYCFRSQKDSENISSYPELYQQFQHMQISQDAIRADQEAMRATQDAMRADQLAMRVSQHTMREEMYAGFSYIFGGLQSAYPSHFGNPPQFSFGDTGNYGAGASGTRNHDGDDDEE